MAASFLFSGVLAPMFNPFAGLTGRPPSPGFPQSSLLPWRLPVFADHKSLSASGMASVNSRGDLDHRVNN